MNNSRTWTPLQRQLFLDKGKPIKLVVDPKEKERRAELENSGILQPKRR